MSRGGPVVRAWNRLRQEGPRGLARALKWKLWHRRDLILWQRRVGPPLWQPPRLLLPPGTELVGARPEHLEAMAANFPERRKWYARRLADPGYDCSLALCRGEVLAHNWFCTHDHFDPDMLWRVPVGPREVYSFEGWVRPDCRGLGIAHLAFRYAFEVMLPGTDVERVFTLIDRANTATSRLHRRYGFTPAGRKTYLRLGPFRFNSAVRPLPDRDRI
ncbi:MAG: N-acetyltransferase [Planctomycetota bacterium]|nr:MAG: N-acetyltransferase [Planctomycetota bacterium]